MENDLEETVIAAFMCKRPVVIVEGQDDIKFYDNIASLKGISIDVQAIEMISGYSEGCEQLCNAMDEVAAIIHKDERLKKYVIGIIDKDVREYLRKLPVKENLLVLKYYSYETHLITDITIKRVLEQVTKMSGSAINQAVIDWIKQDFDSFSNELYYFSLEALKKMYDDSYQADMNYGMKAGTVIGEAKEYRWKLIESKKEDLDQFAKVHSISKNDLKYIAKGKWLLEAWCDYLIKKARVLYHECGKQIPQCKFCKVGKRIKCLWKPSSSFQVNEIESLLNTQEFIDLNEVDYIYKYMKTQLAC